MRFGSDASRIGLAAAGDTIDDANFTLKNADNAVLRLYTLDIWIKETLKNIKDNRNDFKNSNKLEFFDNAFENEMKDLMQESIDAYEFMRFRDCLKSGLFEFQRIKEDYRINVGKDGFRKDLILKYIEYQLLIIYPICPHFSEIIYHEDLYPVLKEFKECPEYISYYRYPKVSFLFEYI